MAKKKASYDVTKHMLVAKHSKLSQKDKKELFDKYSLTFVNLPKISVEDPALKDMAVKEGDVIKIERPSPTAGNTVYYRGVISEQ